MAQTVYPCNPESSTTVQQSQSHLINDYEHTYKSLEPGLSRIHQAIIQHNELQQQQLYHNVILENNIYKCILTMPRACYNYSNSMAIDKPYTIVWSETTWNSPGKAACQACSIQALSSG